MSRKDALASARPASSRITASSRAATNCASPSPAIAVRPFRSGVPVVVVTSPPPGAVRRGRLRGVRLGPVRLRGVRLRGVRLRGVRLRGVRLRGVRLGPVRLRAVGLRPVRLRAVRLRAVGLRAVRRWFVRVRGVGLRRVGPRPRRGVLGLRLRLAAGAGRGLRHREFPRRRHEGAGNRGAGHGGGCEAALGQRGEHPGPQERLQLGAGDPALFQHAEEELLCLAPALGLVLPHHGDDVGHVLPVAHGHQIGEPALRRPRRQMGELLQPTGHRVPLRGLLTRLGDLALAHLVGVHLDEQPGVQADIGPEVGPAVGLGLREDGLVGPLHVLHREQAGDLPQPGDDLRTQVALDAGQAHMGDPLIVRHLPAQGDLRREEGGPVRRRQVDGEDGGVPSAGYLADADRTSPVAPGHEVLRALRGDQAAAAAVVVDDRGDLGTRVLELGSLQHPFTQIRPDDGVR
ncbi:pentapeptide repeat-containing protein [Streptomyces sp. NPDC002143]